tara:strand:+ start:12576 stop:12902 length:327 start_codon:yes stop_codon:yes gene_type:complete
MIIDIVYSKLGRFGMKNIAAFVFIFVASSTSAEPPILVDKRTGYYLGKITSNQNDPDSISNPNGRYGSKYSKDSINNPNGKYGNFQSNDSLNYPYATNKPIMLNRENL